MDKFDMKTEETTELRRRAVSQLRAERAKRIPRSVIDTHRLLRELEVHQVVLEMQVQELQMARDELGLRVAERTRSLETSLREQEAFSYSVSHDLRAPLRHINSYAAFIEEENGDLTEESKANLRNIRASSKMMGKLIDGLLELSSIGRTGITRTNTDLSNLATDIAHNLQQSDLNRHVTFRIEPRITALCDKRLLDQLLQHLLSNSWKYTASKQYSIIEFGKVHIDDADVFIVKDNGIGFDMAYQDKLFGAFQRLHGPEYEGIGIGLAMVKRIIDRHGGVIWANSALNTGTTFFFTL